MKTICLLTISILLIQFNLCIAQAGILDSTFGKNGIGQFVFQNNEDPGLYSEAIQPDGKILIGGTVSFHDSADVFTVARYNTDGNLDNSFANDGQLILRNSLIDYAWGGFITLQPDGKILLSGTAGSRFAVIRMNANGRLDSSFNRIGIAFTPFYHNYDVDMGGPIALQTDGKIVQTGSVFNPNTWDFNWDLVRYNSNGSIDNTFGNNGTQKTTFPAMSYSSCMAIQHDGKIMMAGDSGYQPSRFALARYNTDGTPDNTFGKGGQTTISFGSGIPYKDEDDHCYSLAIQPDGKIIVGGSTDLPTNNTPVSCFARFNSNGTLDTGFGTAGKVIRIVKSIYAWEIASIYVQPDKKILMTGDGLLRYKENGSIDSSFGRDGIIYPTVGSDTAGLNSISMQTDGKIVAAAICVNSTMTVDSGMTVMRFLSGLNTGVLNFTIKNNPVLIYPNPIYQTAELQYNLTQSESITLTLYNIQGKLVQTFFTNQPRQQGEHTEQLHFANLAAGNYILNISNGNSTQGVKIVKQ